MNNIERRNNGMIYISDDDVFEQQKRARRLTQKINTMDRSDFKGISEVVKELFAKSENAIVNPPFYCDYGFNIEIGKISSAITTARSSMSQRSESETTAFSLRTLQSIRRVTPFTLRAETPSTNTESKSQSETMYG